jgi:outer membrane protein insertion porin family/translocation and assembly module TamA
LSQLFTLFRRALVAVLLLGAVPSLTHAQAPTRPVLGIHDSMDVTSLLFDGAHEVSPSDLKRVVFTRTSSCRLILIAPLCAVSPQLLFIDRRRTTPEALGEDITALRVYYWRRGFHEATVDTVVTPRKRGVAVTFRIHEGEPTRISSLAITQREPILSTHELERAVAVQEGEPLDLVALDTTLDRLHVAIWNHGYGDARIDTTVTPLGDPHSMALRITIDPRYLTHVGSVRFEGNQSLSDATLRHGVVLKPGRLYTHDAVLESERRLFSSPAIARAVVVTPPEGDSVKQVTVAIAETPAHQASVTAGFNTIEFGQVAATLRHNALGNGRWLELHAAVGNLLGPQLNGRAIFRQAVPDALADGSPFLSPTYQGSLTLSQPWLGDARTSAAIKAFAGRRSLPGVVVDEDAGVTLGLVHYFGVQFPVGLNYRFESTRVQGGAVYYCAGYGVCDNATIAALQRRQRLSPVGVSAWIDRSDDLEAPTRGYTWVVDAEHASRLTASTFAHDRISADASFYRALGYVPANEDAGKQPMVLALHGRAGWVRPLAEDREALGVGGDGPGILHPRARFYAGGMQSVRGFAENELGPRVLQARHESLVAAGCTDATIADGSCDPTSVPNNVLFPRPVGGSSVIEANVELRVPVRKQLGAVAFLDGAYVGVAGIESPARGKGAITPGLGLRYRSPLGVLRLDVGLRPVGHEMLPVVAAVPDGAGGTRIVRLSQEKSYSPVSPSPGTLRNIGRRLVVHFAMGQAF